MRGAPIRSTEKFVPLADPIQLVSDPCHWNAEQRDQQKYCSQAKSWPDTHKRIVQTLLDEPAMAVSAEANDQTLLTSSSHCETRGRG